MQPNQLTFDENKYEPAKPEQLVQIYAADSIGVQGACVTVEHTCENEFVLFE